LGESQYFKCTEEKHRGIVILPEENDKALCVNIPYRKISTHPFVMKVAAKLVVKS